MRWVAGGPWAAVQDDATRQRYYWRSDTNEVAWTLPEGVQDAQAAMLAGAAVPADAAPAADAALADAGSSLAAQDSVPSDSEHPMAEPTVAEAAAATDVATDAAAEVAAAAQGSSQQQGDLKSEAAAASENAAAPLPPGWRAVPVEGSDEVYYWHRERNLTQWERPSSDSAVLPAVAGGTGRGDDAGAFAAEPAAEEAEAAVAGSAVLAVGSAAVEAPNKPALDCAEEGEVAKQASVVADAHEQLDEAAIAAPAVEVNNADTQAQADGVESTAPAERTATQTQSDAARSGAQTWRELRDAESGDTYFWNIKTGETTWSRPADLDASLVAADTRRAQAGAHDDSAAMQPADALALAATEPVQSGQTALAQSDATASGLSPVSAMAEHARASTAVASALAGAAEGGALDALLPSAPRLLVLHAQLQMRQRDLAALRKALRTRSAAPELRAAAAATCRHITTDTEQLAAELPQARADAAAIVAATARAEPEEGEVIANEVPVAPCMVTTADATPASVHNIAWPQASEPDDVDDALPPPLPSSSELSVPAPLPDDDGGNDHVARLPAQPAEPVLDVAHAADAAVRMVCCHARPHLPCLKRKKVCGAQACLNIGLYQVHEVACSDQCSASVSDYIKFCHPMCQAKPNQGACHVQDAASPPPLPDEPDDTQAADGGVSLPGSDEDAPMPAPIPDAIALLPAAAPAPPLPEDTQSAPLKRKTRSSASGAATKRPKKESSKNDALVSKWQHVAKSLDEEEARFC